MRALTLSEVACVQGAETAFARKVVEGAIEGVTIATYIAWGLSSTITVAQAITAGIVVGGGIPALRAAAEFIDTSLPSYLGY